MCVCVHTLVNVHTVTTPPLMGSALTFRENRGLMCDVCMQLQDRIGRNQPLPLVALSSPINPLLTSAYNN